MSLAFDTLPAPAETTATRAFNLLGGDKLIKRPVRDTLDAHDLIVQGLPSKSLLHLVDGVEILSMGDILNKAVGISLRTLQRRKSDAVKKSLSTEQSSRAWRFAEVIAHATSVLGSQQAAEAWMLEPAIGLDNRKPIDLLASAAGAEAVSDHLTRLEFGVYT